MTSDPVSPPSTLQHVAIGIVTYNNPNAQLRRLLRSIENAAGHLDLDRYGAIVLTIDCGAPSEWMPTRNPFKVLPSRGNLGFGGGMNCLMADAFSDNSVAWFLCVNPDGLFHHDMLAEMLACADRYPESLIEARQFPEEHPKPYHPESGETLWASGACLLIPRRIYESIGGFDDNIFMYMEDVDYSWRARAAGFGIRVAPRALFGHSVLDRKQDITIEKYYYFSARYLAYKWRKREEQSFYEQVIRDRGYIGDGDLPLLPSIDEATAAIPSTGYQVADFSYGFVFSPRRW